MHLADLAGDRPTGYALCPHHADRTRPPRGWELEDARREDARGGGDLGGPATVAVLAAALGRDGERHAPTSAPGQNPHAPGPDTPASASGPGTTGGGGGAPPGQGPDGDGDREAPPAGEGPADGQHDAPTLWEASAAPDPHRDGRGATRW